MNLLELAMSKKHSETVQRYKRLTIVIDSFILGMRNQHCTVECESTRELLGRA